MYDAEAKGVNYASIMSGLAKEMNVLTLQGLNIESSLTGLSLRACSEPELVHDLQLVDSLLQHMAELRGFMSALADGMKDGDPLCVDRALDSIRLHAVQGRLAEALGRAAGHNAVESSGDMELL